MKPSFLSVAAVVLPFVSLHAGPLTEAKIARIINEVSVIKPSDGAHAASMDEVVKDDMAVKTGIKSRSELLFQDDTLTRLGPESLFSFKTGTRDMSLERGTMLLQVPKGIGGAQIHTAAVTASITGTTIMLEHVPGKMLKVLVLEGSLRLSVNGALGDSLLLTPGKMVIMAPDAKHIPDPITVDLKKVVKTSSLVNLGGKTKPLPSVALIDKEIETQAQQLNSQELVATNLAVNGKGSDVRALSSDALTTMETVHAAATPAIPEATPETKPPTSTDSSNSSATPTPPATAAATATPVPSATAAATATPGASATATPAATATATPAASATATPGPSATATPKSTATPGATATPSAAPSATPSSGGGSSPSPTPTQIDDAVVINYGTDTQPLTKDVTLEDPLDLSRGGKHGNVNVISTAKVELKKTIKVSDNASGSSKAGGNITITSRKTKDDAIIVRDSSQLLSLLNAAAPGPGGTIRFTSSGGRIRLDKATITAERGTIDIRNQGAGDITTNGTTLGADVIKLQTMGDKGQLNIGGGTMNANTAIDLYAAGSNGQVNFTDNTTLSGKSVKRIAGDTVTIKNGKTVTVNGPAPANVYTNHPNYSGSGGNGSTTGQFGGSGATTQPFAAYPGGH